MSDPEDDDTIDGCEEDFEDVAITDDDIDGVVLFADLDPADTAAIDARKAEYEELFRGDPS